MSKAHSGSHNVPQVLNRPSHAQRSSRLCRFGVIYNARRIQYLTRKDNCYKLHVGAIWPFYSE